MDKYYERAFAMDNRTGRVVGVDVKATGESFVFTPSKDPNRPFLSSEVPPVEEATFQRFAAIKADARRESETEAAFHDCYKRGLLEFARKHGPLFGSAGKNPANEEEIVEPISDWVTAQSVMSDILGVVPFSKGEEFPFEDFDEHFFVTTSQDTDATVWTYLFDSRLKASSIYQSCLKDDMFLEYSANDGSRPSYIWCRGKIPGDWPVSKTGAGETMFAAATQVYPTERFPNPFPFIYGSTCFLLSEARVITDITHEVGTLLKIVADRHAGGISLGYRNFWDDCDTADEGSYGVLSSCFLSYMWHELAQKYTHNHFHVCENPKCGVIITTSTSSNVHKRFCSEECRYQANNLKVTEQQRRARLAYYDCLPFIEIYEKAFERKYSFKDSERKKLEKRLNRWIEGFKKTEKGKAAEKQGAGRKD